MAQPYAAVHCVKTLTSSARTFQQVHHTNDYKQEIKEIICGSQEIEAIDSITIHPNMITNSRQNSLKDIKEMYLIISTKAVVHLKN